MINKLPGLLLLGCLASVLPAAADCTTDEGLRALDQRYEEALRVGDTKFLQALLAEDFIWVHNLASSRESADELIKRLGNPVEIVQSRQSTRVSIHRLGDAAVLSGVSLVEKGNPDGVSRETLHYQFMRTYVKTADQQCRLLSVQTMKIRTDDHYSSSQ